MIMVMESHMDLTVDEYPCGVRNLRTMLPSLSHFKEYRHETMVSMLHHRQEKEEAEVTVLVVVVQIQREEE